MKKALIIANLGGFVEFLFDDIKILRSMGYEVEYAANDKISNWDVYKNKLIDMNVPIHNVDFASKNPLSKDNLLAYKQIKKILKEGNYDLIHCHTPITGLLTKLAARKYRKSGTKVIYTTHGFTFNKNASKKNWLIFYTIEKFSSKMCDAIITINNEDYEEVKKMWCKQVYYIHGMGVDIAKYADVNINKNEYKEKNGIPTDKIMILSVGELSDRKNHKIIIDAISKLENKEDYVFVICGKGINGGTETYLKERAKELNVNLILMGFRTDIPEIIHCSDIGALPSIREGLGLAGIQSLSAGVPIIATDVQGIKDYIIDGQTGFLCKYNDSEAFAKAIKKLSDENTRKSMKENCKEMAKKFSMEISSKERKEIYNKILK